MILNLFLIIFFLLIFQPLSIFIKLVFKYDPLNLKNKNKKTYKIYRDKKEINLRSLGNSWKNKKILEPFKGYFDIK